MSIEEKYDLSLYQPIETLKESGRVMVELVRHTLDEQLYVKKTFTEPSLRSVFEKIKELSHPGIVGVELIAEDGGKLVIIEQFLPGKTLEHGTPSDRKATIGWALQLCGALEYLHKHDVLHRDLKPGNIMVHDGKLTLFDFDIARTVKADQEKDTAQIGTRGYAPPEQFGYAQTDKRSDIYSLGVILNGWAQGKNDPLAKIARRCTAFDPSHRYQTISALSADLRRNRPGRVILQWAALSVAVLAVFTAIWLLLPRSEAEESTPPNGEDMRGIAEVSPTPGASPLPSPVPTLNPSPITTPEVTSIPEPTSEPSPMPTSALDPSPAPLPTSEPTPAPVPSPPNPIPSPNPSPGAKLPLPEGNPPSGWNRFHEGIDDYGPYKKWFYPDGRYYMVHILRDGYYKEGMEHPNGDYYVKITDPYTGALVVEEWGNHLPDGTLHKRGITGDGMTFDIWHYPDGSVLERWRTPDGHETERFTPA
jgi:serine/threonine protein kinase